MGTVLARVPSLTTSRSRSQPTAFVFSTTHRSWVNLGFNFGSLLPDPDGRYVAIGNGFATFASRPVDLEALFASW